MTREVDEVGIYGIVPRSPRSKTVRSSHDATSLGLKIQWIQRVGEKTRDGDIEKSIPCTEESE